MKNNRLKNATVDLSWAGIIGMCWYIPIFTVIYVGIFLIFGSTELDDMSYTSIGLNANSIFLLVMGIIVGSYYIKWGISLGITRKQFYKANLMSGFGVTVLLTVAVLLIGFLVSLLPFVGSEALEHRANMHPVMNVVTSFVIAFGGYMAGTLIGTGFYRNGWLGALAIIITVFSSYATGIVDPLFVELLGLTEGVGILVTSIVLVIVVAVLHYFFVRNIVIRI